MSLTKGTGRVAAAGLIAAGSFWAGCSSGGSGNDGGADSGENDVNNQQDTSAADAGHDANNTSDASDGGGNVTLTVLNYLAWCSVTINGDTASTSATITDQVADNSTVTIVATPKNASFAVGTDPWFGVDQNDGGAAPGTDVGSGVTETTTATVTVTGAHCVSVCCGDAPKTDGGAVTGCPQSDPCP
jgi:hypothetical protein